MSRKLKPKQEGFCQSYVETGNASEAYRRNYKTDHMSEATVNNSAYRLMRNDEIKMRLEELRKRHQKRHDITVDRITSELYADREAAKKAHQYSASIAALMHVAKLHGLVTDKLQHGLKDASSETLEAVCKRHGINPDDIRPSVH